jgi:hypothetical protein
MDIEESANEFGFRKLFSLINLSSKIRFAEEEAEINQSALRLNRNLRTWLDGCIVDHELRAPFREKPSMLHEFRVYHQRIIPWVVEEVEPEEVLLELPPLYLFHKEPSSVTSPLAFWFRKPTSTRPQAIPLKGPITATYRKPTSLPQRK